MENNIQKLTELFLQFPGIGERQAKRFAYFIVTAPTHYTDALAKKILEARSSVHICTECYRVFDGAQSSCALCREKSRQNGQLLIVEKSTDIDIFLSTPYAGKFFVLQNLIPIVQKKTVKKTFLEALETRVAKEQADGTLKEVILAFPLTPNGIHTDEVVRERLQKITENVLPITSLGRGLSFGTEIEYADQYSLSASLEKRQ
jgi:recombination protein RecR